MMNNSSNRALPSLPISLGAPGSESHMRSFTKQSDKLEAIQHLSPHDYAFVHRSDGRWQCSRVLARSVVKNEPHIKFQLDERGRTKIVPMRQWMDHVRLVKSPKHSSKQQRRRVTMDCGLTEDPTSVEGAPSKMPPMPFAQTKRQPPRRKVSRDEVPFEISCPDLMADAPFEDIEQSPVMPKRRSLSFGDEPFELVAPVQRTEETPEIEEEAMIVEKNRPLVTHRRSLSFDDEETKSQNEKDNTNSLSKVEGGMNQSKVSFLAQLQEEMKRDETKLLRRVTVDCGAAEEKQRGGHRRCSVPQRRTPSAKTGAFLNALSSIDHLRRSCP